MKRIAPFLLIPVLAASGCRKHEGFRHPTVEELKPGLVGWSSSEAPPAWEAKAAPAALSAAAAPVNSCGGSGCHNDGRRPDIKPHDEFWVKVHGDVVMRDGFGNQNYCAACHAESHCSDCHQKEPPAFHTRFWMLKGHGLTVGLDRNRCAVCHRSANFCERCHNENPPFTHSGAWVAPVHGHCVSCHLPLSAASPDNCAVCHTGTPSHDRSPKHAPDANHQPGADCQACHTPPLSPGAPRMPHPSSGTNASCETCHL